MSERYYLAPICGDGSTAETSFRAMLPDAPYHHHVSYIPNKADGSPQKTWCLVVIDADKHVPFISDHALAFLPDIDLDEEIGGHLARVRRALARFDIDHSGITGGTTLAELVAFIMVAAGTSVTAGVS
jgi:hypothetical protein